MKENMIGEAIIKSRGNLKLTQDEYGSRYDVSGPAIFKFEKGFVKPSFELWIKMSKDMDIDERRAVLIFSRTKLPDEYAHYIELLPSRSPRKTDKSKGIDYSKCSSREEIIDLIKTDKKMPKEMKDFLSDDELWGLYRPSGLEIETVKDLFSLLGKGTVADYREALYLVRKFSHTV